MQRDRRSSELERLAALATQLHLDADREPAELLRRDRRIATDHLKAGDAADRLDTWLAATGDELPQQAADRVRSGQTLAAVVMIAAGLLIGGGAAAAVFRYDGEHPVNILAVLGVFVGLQLLTLVLTAIAMLPAGLQRRVPSFAAVQRAVMAFSPGRLAPLLVRRLPDQTRQQLEPMLGRSAAQQALYSRVSRWMVLHLAQLFGVSFNAGALAVALGLVTTTDLAFAWSTTLQVDADQVHALVEAVAWPWAGVVEHAVPDQRLVAATQYERAAGFDRPAAWGRWWSFAVMAMLVYGLLPRVATWLIARWRLTAALRWTADHLPGLPMVHGRLTATSRPTEPGGSSVDPAPSGTAIASERVKPTQVDAPLVLAWAAPPTVSLLAEPIAAGGPGVDDDRRALERVQAAAADRPVLIVTKAWEPPVAELFDFVEALREAGEPTRPIMLLPVASDDAAGAALPDAHQLEVWRRRAATVGDPWLAVVTLEEFAP